MQVSGVTAKETRDQFLHLLVTQLQHQDPLEPMKQEEFLTQLAQFSTLEGIENLQSVIEAQTDVQQETLRFQQLGQAADLVGKRIQYVKVDGDGEQRTRSGVVELVSIDANGLSFKVQGDTISWSDILSISGHGTIAADDVETSGDAPSTDDVSNGVGESNEQDESEQATPSPTGDDRGDTQQSIMEDPFRRTRGAMAEVLPQVEPALRRGRDAFLEVLAQE